MFKMRININKNNFTIVHAGITREIAYDGYDAEEIKKSPPASYDVNCTALKGIHIGTHREKFSTFCEAFKSSINRLNSAIDSKHLFSLLDQKITIYGTNDSGQKGYFKESTTSILINEHDVNRVSSHHGLLDLINKHGIENIKILLFKRNRIRWLSISYFQTSLLTDKETKQLMLNEIKHDYCDLLVLTSKQSKEDYGQLELFA